MKRKLLTGIVTLTVCISMFAATNMCIKLEDGQIVKYDVENVVEVYYETNINDTTPPLIDSFIVDASETSLEFRFLSDTTAEVAKGDQDLDTLNIPSKVRIDGKVYKVTSIGYAAFSNCSSLASITIPEGVTSIGDHVFEECTSLASITIPESVTSIGDHVFEECTSLASITIPEGVTIIGFSTFSGCSKLASITIPKSVKSIESFAFASCTNLASITIPESVTYIGSRAFSNCENLDVVIENSKENVEIEDSSFPGWKSVTYTK